MSTNKATYVPYKVKDISLAGRVLASFSHCLDKQQKLDDALSELGKLVLNPNARALLISVHTLPASCNFSKLNTLSVSTLLFGLLQTATIL